MSKASQVLREIIRKHFQHSPSALQQALGLRHRQSVSGWLSESSPIPPMRALQIEQLLGIDGLAVKLNPKCAVLTRKKHA